MIRLTILGVLLCQTLSLAQAPIQPPIRRDGPTVGPARPRPGKSSEIDRATIERIVTFIIKPRNVGLLPDILWRMVINAPSTGMSADFVKDQAVIKKVQQEYLQQLETIRSLDRAIPGKRKELEAEIKNERDRIAKERRDVDIKESDMQAWADQEGDTLAKLIEIANGKAKAFKVQPPGARPAPINAQEEAAVQNLWRQARNRIYTGCPNRLPFHKCTHELEKREFIRKGEELRAQAKAAEARLNARRLEVARYQNAVKAKTNEGAALSTTADQLAARRRLYYAKIDRFNKWEKEARAGLDQDEKKLEVDKVRRLQEMGFLQRAIQDYLKAAGDNPALSINRFWRLHPDYARHQGRSMPPPPQRMP